MIDQKKKEAATSEYLNSDLTSREAAEKWGMSSTTILSEAKKRKNTAKEAFKDTDQPTPRFDNLPKEQIDPIKVLEKAAKRVASHKETNKDYHKVVIDTKEPIAIMKLADFHFGGLDVDYKSFLAHANFLLNTPNFYSQYFGDDLNMMIMHKNTGARHDGWTPAEQMEWLTSYVNKLLERNKIISMGWGNHSDEFTERNAGFGLVRMLMKHKVPYFRGLGYLDLQVGKQTYPMGFAHKVRFSSFMHATHGSKRMLQMHAEFFGADRPIAKEYITAHHHNPAFSMSGCLPSERIYHIACGTFKTDDLYAQRYYGQGRIGVPTVVYHPDRFEHVCFPTPWEAYRYMNGTDKQNKQIKNK